LKRIVTGEEIRVATVEDDAHVGQLMCLWLDEATHSSRHYLSGKPFLQDMESFDFVMLERGQQSRLSARAS